MRVTYNLLCINYNIYIIGDILGIISVLRQTVHRKGSVIVICQSIRHLIDILKTSDISDGKLLFSLREQSSPRRLYWSYAKILAIIVVVKQVGRMLFPNAAARRLTRPCR